MLIRSGEEVIAYCKKNNKTLFQYAMEYEGSVSGICEDEMIEIMANYWSIMKKSIDEGLDLDKDTKGHIIGNQAAHLFKAALNDHKSASGKEMNKAIGYALAVMEVNAGMGHIVSAPTAGSSGVIPAVFKSLQDNFGFSDQRLFEGLYVGSLIGGIIAGNAYIAGARGGCQAEVGTASAMAAGGGLYMLDASLEDVFNGAAITLKNLMGLICDPVAGLVEVPCQKRNAMGVANALISIDMVRYGMGSFIPFDEVVQAMKRVGDMMPTCHKETGTGGVANTKTGLMFKEKIFS